MKKWSAPRILVVFLALWVALAPVGFAIPAAAMTGHSAMAEEAMAGGCDSCPEKDANNGLCALMCQIAESSAITIEAGKLAGAAGDGPVVGHYWALLDCLAAPDPAPPKPVSLL